MELKDDSELRSVLREWTAPEPPASLDERVLGPAQSWWQFLLSGYIRVPVPVACALAILIVFAGWRIVKPLPAGTCTTLVTAPATSCPADSHC